MLISASYKTDIPAFYGPWFLQRLQAGFCHTRNPYNQQVSIIPLTPDHVDGFIFWTKNISPFLSCLQTVRHLGYPFLLQYTITGYPRELEERVCTSTQTVASLRAVAATYGSAVPVWRYDPVLLTSLTPADWHRRNFAALARSLQGATDEVVVSFAQIYQKTRRNLQQAAASARFSWQEHEQTTPEQAQALLAELAEIAAAYGMQLTICSQPQLQTPGLTRPARCIDAERLQQVSGRAPGQRITLKGNRPGCRCFASRDIGEYDTCPHGCLYCYAVHNRSRALAGYMAHDPLSPALFPSPPRHLPCLHTHM
jgi:hypothetical protein